ncbi:hypothetical protein HU200_035885 [Digitaria exilis]|uniref:Protein kinase domain-containing protein n=1 Tax=Digitaria exilis TaxID=1010633 RepID=A0A835BE23_9POAL|nr:hypothetical protein HU200_035885 [Digitaria exilis]
MNVAAMWESSRLLTVTRTVLLAVAAAAAALLPLSSSQDLQIGLPGCPTSCGDVSVPYPFGIAPGCSLAGFGLTCDTTHTPPLLLVSNSTLQVTGVSLDNSTVRVLGPAVNFSQMLRNGTAWTTISYWGGLPWGLGFDGPYVSSEARNEFIVWGCNIFAELRLGSAQLITSCGSVCDGPGPGNYADNECALRYNGSRHCGRCYGVSCCQMPVPIGSTFYFVRLTSMLDSEEDFAAVIAEEGWLDRGVAAEAARSSGEMKATVPVVLAWAIAGSSAQPAVNETRDGDATCPTDLDSTGCHSSYSSCTNELSNNDRRRRSYTCKCWHGYQGNPYLPDGCQGLSIGLGVGSGAVLLFVVIASTFIFRKIKSQRKKKLRQRFFKQNRGQLLQQLLACESADIAERMIITLKELEKATNNFDKARELGGGGHGMVYKGILSSLHVVAIKKSKIVVQREIDDFINEVAILSQINHRNIVKLFGCCLETKVPLLVYEFITNGTLYNHLHVEAPIALSWKDRLRIAVETARALAYLHSFVSLAVIHRDIKSPNILLNDNLTVKLSDFGASRHIPVDQTGVDTVVQGTFGYLDPTYYSTGHLTEKSDVYSFGVILIELITRKKPVSYRSAQGYGLARHFVTLVSENNLDQILDPQVTQEGGGEVVDIALLAAMCVKFTSEERPTMRQVEMTLESIYAAKEFDSSEVTDEDFDEN